MVNRESRRSDFPRRIALPGDDGVYERVNGMYATHDRPAEASAEGAELVLADGRVAVFRGDLAAAGGGACAVYATPGGPLAVPTGRVFVRFRHGVSAEERRHAVEDAGYAVDRIPGYAPQAAWVCSTDGAIGSGLSGLARLRALPDVEHVEPEFLTENHPRA